MEQWFAEGHSSEGRSWEILDGEQLGEETLEERGLTDSPSLGSIHAHTHTHTHTFPKSLRAQKVSEQKPQRLQTQITRRRSDVD